MRNRLGSWTGIETAFLRVVYADHTTIAIAAVLERTVSQVYAKAKDLELKKSAQYLASDAACRLRRGDNVGKQYRFEKGHVPANKGLRRPGYAPGRMAETQFKKGAMAGAAQHNYVPIGSLRVTKDGILERKVTDDPAIYPAKRWVSVARLVWEAAHGPLQPGQIVRFKPGQRTVIEDEITLGRLECISKAENMRRNSIHNYPEDIMRATLARGALNRRINREQKHQRSA